MDSIQKALVKAGRKDLAQKYYEKLASLGKVAAGMTYDKNDLNEIDKIEDQAIKGLATAAKNLNIGPDTDIKLSRASTSGQKQSVRGAIIKDVDGTDADGKKVKEKMIVGKIYFEVRSFSENQLKKYTPGAEEKLD